MVWFTCFLTHLPTIHYNISSCNSRFLVCCIPVFLSTAELADLCMNHCYCILQPNSASTHTSNSGVLNITCFIKDYSHSKACQAKPLTSKTI